MRAIISSIEGELRRYRGLAMGTLEQLDDEQLCRRVGDESNSIATIVWHIAGNLASRFTDFAQSDGEKPWRQREDEFAPRDVTKEEVRAKWDEGWHVLMRALAELDDEDLSRPCTIRGVDFTVGEALQRAFGHLAYHVGQITYLGKMLNGPQWTYLTIPPGGTAAYNANPTHEKV